jgi:peptidoglycan hydrolase-like protein with peptidoglycan-binding domain
VFDAPTDTALRNFQTQRGLPVTGTTDSPTWQALLALTPIQVTWTTKNKPAFTARRTRVAKAPRSARLPARKREIPVLGRR